MDGSSNSCGSGAGLIITNSEGFLVEYALRFLFKVTNNQSEYEALLVGLKIAQELKIKNIKIFSDSQLIVGQVSGEYEARNPTMASYLHKVCDSITTFEQFDISHIPRKENARADTLSRLATSTEESLGRTFIEYLEAPSIEKVEEIQQITDEPSWKDSFIRYLSDGILPTKIPSEIWKFKRKASQFVLMDGQLYKKSYSFPLLKCLGPTDADYVLREIHEGICGNHSGGRSLVYKALRQSYYWLTMKQEAMEFV